MVSVVHYQSSLLSDFYILMSDFIDHFRPHIMQVPINDIQSEFSFSLYIWKKEFYLVQKAKQGPFLYNILKGFLAFLYHPTQEYFQYKK